MEMADFVLLFGNQISYTSILYYFFLPFVVFVYYMLPKKHRWLILLAASVLFYRFLFSGRRCVFLFAATILMSWLFSLLIESTRRCSLRMRKVILAGSILIAAVPLLLMDITKMIMPAGEWSGAVHLIVPVGLSFYTLQIIAYLSDVYSGKANAQHNLLKYALFISFFPQILQGPIPRYEYLSHQLIEGNEFDPDNIQRGFQLILWGFFLKYMIADKAGVVVNTVFDNASAYSGLYYAVAGSLYSLQLYTDFLACTTLSKGAAVLFGIRLPENFNHPYFANSIRDFWRRWHISLSTWLRDYIYIPLGGNRKGKGRKYLNLVITFLISGVWHGGTLKYMFWGFLHGVYQIVGEMTYKIRDHICMVFGLDYDSKLKNVLQTIVTFIFVTLGWIIFRADTLQNGLHMIRSIAVDFNPWVLSGTYLFNMGLSQNECVILMISVLLLFGVSLLQERGYKIGESVMNLHVVFRYVIYLAGILIVMIYGTYGFGFNASDFIYRGF